MFYDDKIFVHKNPRITVIKLQNKVHLSIHKVTTAAQPLWLWWPKMGRESKQKCDNCIPCKMTGKSIKLSMTEKNVLPPTQKPNQEICFNLIGPMRLKQRRFFNLVSIYRYSRWPTACICDTRTEKTATRFLNENITFIGTPQTIRTVTGMAFTEGGFEEVCRSLNT